MSGMRCWSDWTRWKYRCFQGNASCSWQCGIFSPCLGCCFVGTQFIWLKFFSLSFMAFFAFKCPKFWMIVLYINLHAFPNIIEFIEWVKSWHLPDGVLLFHRLLIPLKLDAHWEQFAGIEVSRCRACRTWAPSTQTFGCSPKQSSWVQH